MQRGYIYARYSSASQKSESIEQQIAIIEDYAKRNNIVTLMPDSTDKCHLPIIINTEDHAVQVAGRVIWHMNPDDMERYY